jgi:hypothetical protein
MSLDYPQPLLELAELQSGVLSRKQALDYGLSPAVIERMTRSGDWPVLRRGVYSIYTGRPTRTAQLWAVTLRAGPDAAISHHTAAELHGLYDEPSGVIHVSVPVGRHIAGMPGVAIHRSGRLTQAAQTNLSPPRTRIEETVLDLADHAGSFDDAFNIAAAACQRRLTTPGRLRAAMTRRGKMRWRADLMMALAEIGAGAHSLLEFRYVRRVEAPHKLPRAVRQAEVVVGGQKYYLDNLYDEYCLGVELDGLQAHPDDRRWLDVRRDNATASLGIQILRYGWADVNVRQCAVAIEVGAGLGARGWTGKLRPCGPHCPVGGQ